LLEAFISEPAVIAELAKLVRGRTPDLDTLVESFAEVTAGHTLPPMDVTARLAASVEAFVQVAEQEAELATIMQTAHLREATQSLRDLACDVQAIRQAVALVTSRTGDVTATRDITAHNLVTGSQTIHIAYHGAMDAPLKYGESTRPTQAFGGRNPRRRKRVQTYLWSGMPVAAYHSFRMICQ
jgi:hypothetical protein